MRIDGVFVTYIVFLSMIFSICGSVIQPLDIVNASIGDVTNGSTIITSEDALSKLVQLFGKLGAFNKVDGTLGNDNDNLIEESTSCPPGHKGLECRRSEAHKTVECPREYCYCYDCAAVGPELWAFCCREVSRCCSHLSAACRTCDHPTLYPFCSKHFNKCGAINPLMKIGQHQSP